MMSETTFSKVKFRIRILYQTILIRKNSKKSLILFGGNTKKQDGPLLTVAKIAKKKQLDVVICTEELHLDLPTKNGDSLESRLNSLGMTWLKLKELTPLELSRIMNENSIGFSLNSIWIFKKDIIDLFNGQIYNYHDTPLPQFRGAAAYSWMILMNQKEWGLTIHKVTDSLDVGDIVKQRKFKFPNSCRIPSDFYEYKTKFEERFFSEFLDDVFSGRKLKAFKQKNQKSSYWPRLSTPSVSYTHLTLPTKA